MILLECLSLKAGAPVYGAGHGGFLSSGLVAQVASFHCFFSLLARGLHVHKQAQAHDGDICGVPPFVAQPKYFGLVSGDSQACVSIGVHLG